MRAYGLVIVLMLSAVLLNACAAPTPVVSAPTATRVATAASLAASTAAPAATTARAAASFSHTACASGVNLAGQTITFYNLTNPTAEVITPTILALQDAADYFNAHGGICGATVVPNFPDPDKNYDVNGEYRRVSTASPKPALIGIYNSAETESLSALLARDQIVGLGVRAGSVKGLYGADGQTLGWVFDTNPTYADQLGAFCQYLSQHPQQYPHPIIGYLGWDDQGGHSTHTPETIGYCASLGVKVLGTPAYFQEGAPNIRSQVQQLLDGGANIIYSGSLASGPVLIAKTLQQLGLRDSVTLAVAHGGLDASVGLLGKDDLGPGGLPAVNGLLGSLPARSLSEAGQPGIQLIAEQADLHQRPLSVRNNFYVLGWTTMDLFIELYVRTGNRVGFDHVTGPEMKKTLETIVYSPLGGLETIDYQGGRRRALAADRIGQLTYLGRDGQNPVGPNNPLLIVTEGGIQMPVPLLVPLTDFQAAPDLRPGGADVPVQSAPTLPAVAGKLAFGSNRTGDYDIYVMNADGTGLINLTQNPARDIGPAWSPDGTKIAFTSDRGGNPEVYVMNADGSGLVQLTFDPGDHSFVNWSPGGSKITYSANGDGNYQGYVINSDGTGQTRLPFFPMGNEGAEWSPDKTKIVYGGISVMNADGSHPTQIVNGPGFNGFPAWSPDGKKIAFCTDRDGNPEIYMMNPDGSGQTRLTNNPAVDCAPAWLPNGTQLSFTSDRDGNDEIYVMNLDGSGLTRLTNNLAGDGGDGGVSWLPVQP